MSSIDPIVPGGVGDFGGGPISIVNPPFDGDSTPITPATPGSSVCSYSLDGITWVALPVGPQFNLQMATEEVNIVRETDSGYRRIYRQFRREVWRVTFKVQQPALEAFQTLHEAVHGSATRFFFTLDRTTDPIVWIYGRKTAGVVFRGTGDKAIPPVFAYDLTIQGDPY